MTAESILEQITQKPFRPIALKTIGGARIEIDNAEDIFVYDRMKTTCVVLFDPVGRKFIFEPEQITANIGRNYGKSNSACSSSRLSLGESGVAKIQFLI